MTPATDTTTDLPLWIAAHEAPSVLRIPSGTVRSLASRQRIHPRGLDRSGRPLYSTEEIRAAYRPRRPVDQTSAKRARSEIPASPCGGSADPVAT